jgi:hypothetical protein
VPFVGKVGGNERLEQAQCKCRLGGVSRSVELECAGVRFVKHAFAPCLW